MARPTKQGLDYFPFDVAFFEDRGIRAVKRRYGADGLMIYIYTLTAIYRDKGYYVKFDDDLKDDIGEVLNMDDNKIQQVINFLCERSLFDNKLFASDKVLTSHGIQLRYQKAKAETGKKRDIEVDERLWVLKKEETESFIKLAHFEGFPRKNLSFSRNNESFSREKSLNKSKVKESKVNEMSGADAHAHHDNDIKMVSVSIGRELTHGEKCAVKMWRQSLGMSGEMIALACDRCVTYKGQFITAYVNAILQKWHRQGICTVEQANAADGVLSNNKQDKSLTDHDELEKLAFKNL